MSALHEYRGPPFGVAGERLRCLWMTVPQAYSLSPTLSAEDAERVGHPPFICDLDLHGGFMVTERRTVVSALHA